MHVVNFGAGFAPSVCATNDGWLVAVGGRQDGVMLFALGSEGQILYQQVFSDGFGFPVVTEGWLGYKLNDANGSRARLHRLKDQSAMWTFSPAEGNFPLAINASWFAWQSEGMVRRVGLNNPDENPILIGPAAPDGIAWLIYEHTVLVKDVRFSLPGMLNPQWAQARNDGSTLWIGEQPDLAPQWPLGMATSESQRVVGTGESHGVPTRGWLLGGQECNTPRIAAQGDRIAIITWGRDGVRLVLLDRQEFIELPAPPSAAPVPEPPPQPEPPPMPRQGITAAQFETLVRLRSQLHPTLAEIDAEDGRIGLSAVTAGLYINACAWHHRDDPAGQLGMQEKSGGTGSISTVIRNGQHVRVWNGIRIIRNGEHIGQDVFVAASIGRFEPALGVADVADPQTFVAPVNPTVLPEPPPPLPPQPDLVPRIIALEQQVSALQLHERQLRDDLTALQVRLDRLETREYTVTGATKPTGTGPARHSHKLTLPVTVVSVVP